MNDMSSWSLIILFSKGIWEENFTRPQLYPWCPLNKRLGRPQSRTGLLEKTEVHWTYDKLIVLRQMYSVLINFYRMYINGVLAVRITFSNLGLAATVILYLQIGIRIIVCGWIRNMSNVCCMPTVFGINYDPGLIVALIPMDQYFC